MIEQWYYTVSPPTAASAASLGNNDDAEIADWQKIEHGNDSMSYSGSDDNKDESSSESVFSFEWITESSLDSSEEIRPPPTAASLGNNDDAEFDDLQKIDHDDHDSMSYSGSDDSKGESSSESVFSFEWISESSLDSEEIRPSLGASSCPEDSLPADILWERVKSTTSRSDASGNDSRLKSSASSPNDQTSDLSRNFASGSADMQVPTEEQRVVNEEGIMMDWKRITTRKDTVDLVAKSRLFGSPEQDASSEMSNHKNRKKKCPSPQVAVGVETAARSTVPVSWIRNNFKVPMEDDEDMPYERHGGRWGSVYGSAEKWFERWRLIPEERRGDFSTFDNLFWVRHLGCPATGEGEPGDMPRIIPKEFVYMPIVTMHQSTLEPRKQDDLCDHFLWIRNSPTFLSHAHSMFLALSRSTNEDGGMDANDVESTLLQNADDHQDSQPPNPPDAENLHDDQSSSDSYLYSYSHDDHYYLMKNFQSIVADRLLFWTEGMDESDYLSRSTTWKDSRSLDAPINEKKSFASLDTVGGQDSLHNNERPKADKLTDESSVMSFETLETHISKLSDDHDNWDYEIL